MKKVNDNFIQNIIWKNITRLVDSYHGVQVRWWISQTRQILDYSYPTQVKSDNELFSAQWERLDQAHTTVQFAVE